MRAQLITSLTLLCVLAACEPKHKCGGALYYDAENVSCRPCPSGARFDDGTCVCSAGAVFMNHRCVSSGAPVDAAVSPSCEAYCDFVNVCLAESDFATGVVPAVVDRLHAQCASDCAAVGGDGALAACIADGSDAAGCADNDSQDGLRATITLLAQCSRAHADDPLRQVICMGLLESSLVANQIDFCD